MKRKIALALAAVMSVTSFAGFGVSATSSLITRTINNWAAKEYVIGEGVAEGVASTIDSVKVANNGYGTSYEVDFTRAAVNNARFSLSLDNSANFGYGYKTDLVGTGRNSNVANAATTDAGTYVNFRESATYGKLFTTGMTEAELVIAGETLTAMNGTGKSFAEKFIFNEGTANDVGFFYDADITYSPAATVKTTPATSRALTVQDVYNAAALYEDESEDAALTALGNYFVKSTPDANSGSWDATNNTDFYVSSDGTEYKLIPATVDDIEEYIADGGSYTDVVYSYTHSGTVKTVSSVVRYIASETGKTSDVYTLYVPSTEKSKMYVTFPYGTTDSATVSIPLAFKLGDNSNVTSLTVDAMNSGISGLGTSYKLTANLVGTTLTVTDGKATGKDFIPLNTITVKENAAGVFRSGNYFDLTLTDDFAFTTDGAFTSSVLGANNAGFVVDTTTNTGTNSTTIYKDEATAKAAVGGSWSTNWSGTGAGKAAVAYYKDTNKTEIRIYFNPGYETSGMVASIILKGAYVGGENNHQPVSGDIVSISVKKNGGMGSVTEESAEIAEFTELGIAYVAATAKEVYSGVHSREAAKVTITENLINSWAANRRTEFTLVDKDGNTLDNVKFTYVKFADTSNIANHGGNDATVYNIGGNLGTGSYVYYNEAGNVVTLNNLAITGGSRAKLSIISYLSAAPGFEGEVWLKISGTAVSGESVANGGMVHIATFSEKVDIKANATVIPANTTSYTIGEIVISEINKGVLGADSTIVLAFTKNGVATTDVRFRNVNKDNLTVDGVRASVSTDNTSGVVTITIDRASTTEGTITLKDLGVVVSSGLTSGVYDLTINGTAIANNIDITRNATKISPASGGASIEGYDLSTADKRNTTGYNRDAFDVDGYVVTGYVLIGTSGEKAALDMTVVYTSGSAVVVANGEAYQMELAPLNVNGSLFVPVRYTLTPYMGEAFANDNVVWDGTTGTAFITVGDTRVEFVSGSTVYRVYVNGILTNIAEMTDANGTPVKAMIEGGRMFVPVRQFANAFGLDTKWDAETGEATFTLAK